jgi:hypothetical protein
MSTSYSAYSKKRPTMATTAIDARADGILKSSAVLNSKEDYRREIAALWSDAAEKFLLIGRYLVRAKESLPHGEFQDLIERELPFSYAVARQLKTVAEKVDAGYVAPDRVPRSYSTAFVLLTMQPEELRQAEGRGLVRPDVTRSALLRFLKEIRLSSVPAHRLARREYRKLRHQRDSILSRMAELEAEYGDDLDSDDDEEDDSPLIEGTAVEVSENV